MPLDPIHTLRAAKRLHLKDAIFVSLAPPAVFEGHLRAVNGKIVWLGPASAVERGEDILECWRQVVMPGLAIAGVDPLEGACRALAPERIAQARARLELLLEENHKTLALQSFIECASMGVLSPIVHLTGAAAPRVRGVAAAAQSIGLRVGLEWTPATPEEQSLAIEINKSENVRILREPLGPHADIAAIVHSHPIPAGACLSARGGVPDAFALLRALEAREAGLGFSCLAANYAALANAYETPFGSFARGAYFDVIFLDYELPAKLDNNNIKTFINRACAPSHVEAAAVASHPVLRRHEVISADRAAVAQGVVEIIEKVL